MPSAYSSLRVLIGQRKAELQQFCVTTVAVLASWGIGSLFSEVDALVAAILTLITLRPSVQASLSEAAVQLVGTALGITVALSSLALFGDNPVSVGVSVAAALLISRLLRLGEVGTLGIAVTALIIVGPGLSSANALDRAWGTLIGVAVAVLFSFWVQPSTPLRRVRESVADLSVDCSGLLSRMASGVLSGYRKEDAAEWLAESRLLSQQIEVVREQDTESLRWAKWSPLARRAEAEAAHASFLAVEHSVVQVRTIARSFYDAAHEGTLFQDAVGEALSGALNAASEGVEQAPPHVELSESTVSNMVESSKNAIAAVVDESDSTEELLLGASVVANVQRIADSVSADHPAITEVASPSAPPTPVQEMAGALSSATLRVVRRGRRRRARADLL